jgi:hypothetical protein
MSRLDDLLKLPPPWGKLADGSPGYRKAEIEHHEKRLLSKANHVWLHTAQAILSELPPNIKKRRRVEKMIQETFESIEPERPYEIDMHLGPWW